MLAIPDDKIASDIAVGNSEAYELSRVALLRQPGVTGELQTTSRNWPIAWCGVSLGWRTCGLGFLIDEAFVEADFYPENGADPNQGELWDVASAIDAKLRALARPTQ